MSAGAQLAVALHPVREVRRRGEQVALVEVAGAVREHEVLREIAGVARPRDEDQIGVRARNLLEQLRVRTGAHEDDFLALGSCADSVSGRCAPAASSP